MPTKGTISEVVENSGVFKIRTDHDDFTSYEIQNRNKQNARITMAFKDCANIRFEPSRFVTVAGGDNDATLVLNAVVKASETVPFVALYTRDSGQSWNFDYDLTIDGFEAFEWLE